LKRALIAGITGQDGAYLAQLLRGRGFDITGTTRDAGSADLSRLERLGLVGQVTLRSMLPTDYRSVLKVVAEQAPDAVFFLAGQTSVGLSFEQPVEAIESISLGILNVLEAVRFVNPRIRVFNAGSSECFGDTGGNAADEHTPFRPRSPYAVAKVCAHNIVANYREAYGLFACTGILFNHESPLRPQRFVTQKIVKGAFDIARGRRAQLRLGNLDVARDWGWAPDYVDAMRRMVEADAPGDYVIATGRTVSLRYFVQRTFEHFGLDWQRHVVVDDALRRPSDITAGAANPSAIARALGWRAGRDVDGVITGMCRACEYGILEN
jgi:GDPmannose 4,6-dehydratase